MYTFILFVIYSFFFILIKEKKKLFINIILIFVIILSSLFYFINFAPERFKKSRFFLTQNKQELILSNPAAIYESIDNIRYAEDKLFFSQDLFSILFGNGLGSGLHDKNGIINVNEKDLSSSFIIDEYSKGYFLNFHTPWTDFGTRFGLLAITLFFLMIVKNLIRSKTEIQLFFNIIIVYLAINVWFSILGLVVLFMFLMIQKNNKDFTQ